ncbi:DUF427 domain-containing protein [Rhodovulum sp. DZ06]|uniref:DUF427 domain-containing protein n=1 Tax=Rhodovulum sp. DZ06 TaxID=3425126 RepID=UPI003D3402D7
MNDDSLTIAPVGGVIAVRAGGAVLAESSEALAATAPGAEAPVHWLPMADASLFLDRTEQIRDIPGVGAARGYDINAKSGPIPLAAWALEAPAAGAEALKDHVFFEGERVAVERL